MLVTRKEGTFLVVLLVIAVVRTCPPPLSPLEFRVIAERNAEGGGRRFGARVARFPLLS